MMFFITLFLTFHSTTLAAGSKDLSNKSIYQLEQQWTSQEGKIISLKDLIGHPTITTMIFTSCPGACPLMVSDMKAFDKQLSKKEKKNVRYVAFSIDPARDTPAALLLFAKKMKLDPRWTLLTSNADQTREIAAVLGFSYKSVGEDFTHSTSLFLLSSDGEILSRKERSADWKEFLEKFRKANSKSEFLSVH